VDEVLFGNLFATDYGNIARVVALEAGLPVSTPAATLNRQCATSLTAFAMGAAMIAAGQADTLVVGGVESDSRRPYVMEKPTAAYQMQPPQWARLMVAARPEDNVSMIETAEIVAERCSVSREDCDAFAVESHRRAAAAWGQGLFDSQVAPVEVPGPKGQPPSVFKKDESLRPDTTMEALAKLRPLVKEGGAVTAGNSSPMNDGAGALVIMERERAKSLGLTVWGRFAGNAAVGLEPREMGLGPSLAVPKLLAAAGRRLGDVDLVEMNEAFASQSVACARALGLDPARLNVNGGAIALGHPLAATGAILVTKLVHEMARRGAGCGVVTFCAAGGQGVAVLVDRE
jgi:acetyl-CoA C-acetyltransferase